MGEITTLQPAAGGQPQFRPPEPLLRTHDLSGFNCSNRDLNLWLRHHALSSEAKTARTYVVCVGNHVIAYYVLAAGSVVRGILPSAKLRHNTPEQIPVMLLGRIATDTRYERRGIGRGMLREAIVKTVKASETIGVRGLVAHAIDPEAVSFYLKFGFILCLPISNRTVILPVETAKAAIGGES